MYQKSKTLASALAASLLSAMPADAAALFDFSFTAPLYNGDTATGGGRITTDDANAAGHYLLRSITGSIKLYDGDTMFRPINAAAGTGGPAEPVYLYRDSGGTFVTDGLTLNADGGFMAIGFTRRTNGLYDGFATEVGIRGATLSFAQRVSAVPEPANWAMLIAGFGTIGFALRRRPTLRIRYA